MKETFKTYERSIKKKHHFAWKLQHQEEFRTSLSSKGFVATALLTFKELGWTVVYYDDKSVEAKTAAKGFQYSQKITVTFQHGKVLVHSLSPDDNFWDKGINSKRVRLFMYAFQEIDKEMDSDTLSSLEQEIERANSWDDYVVPNSLPAPKDRPNPKLWMTLIGSVVLAVVFGFSIALLSYYWTYYIVAFELFTGLLLAGAFGLLIKTSHYTKFSVLNGLLMGVVLSIYSLNQYFFYLLLVEGGMPAVGFFSYFQMSFEAGLQLDDNDLGKIGLVLSWLLQLVLTYSIAYHFLKDSIADYKAARVPNEVLTFALYYFSKNNKEESVRLELAKKGWKKKEDQEDVFVAIAAMKSLQEFNRNA